MSILFQNAEKTVIVIDIPNSIIVAQGNSENAKGWKLLCSEPLQKPIVIENEPKKASLASQKHVPFAGDDLVHKEIRSLIEKVLEEIRKEYQAPWCRARADTQTAAHGRHRKRKRTHDDKDQKPLEKKWTEEVDPYLYANDLDSGALHLAPSRDTPCQYWVPPKSSFVLGSVENSMELFQDALTKHLNVPTVSCPPRQFDMIILDPPWPNASAKRSSSYDTPKDYRQIEQLLYSMGLDSYLGPQGIVGVWITNKPRYIDLVRQLFEDWGVELVEEWIWIKTTAHGKPATSLDSVWRKPYEIFYIAKRCETPCQKVKRRVIAAVPDLHSRKPCLKELLHLVLPNTPDIRVLEIFARHLTAGWWSWGNEATKFNVVT